MTTPSTSAMVEHLKTMGIRNGRQLAEHVQAPAVIYFFMRDRQGGDDPRAELHYWGYDDDGEYHETEVFRPILDNEAVRLPVSKLKHNAVEQAKTFAFEELEIHFEEWRGAPFANCWMPRESLNRIREEIGIPPFEEVVLQESL